MVTLCLLATVSCTSRSVASSTNPNRTITVAQSGSADVIGSDSASLQKAADMLRSGKTILLKSQGVESALTEDADFGESYLFAANPERFHPGMGVEISDDTLKEGWEVSISKVVAVRDHMLQINPPTVRDYHLENKYARIRNTYPMLCATNAKNVTFEALTVDGNKTANSYLDGSRSGAIYLYNVRNITVKNCVARNYNGDGISLSLARPSSPLRSRIGQRLSGRAPLWLPAHRLRNGDGAGLRNAALRHA